MAKIRKTDMTKRSQGVEQMESAAYTAGRCGNTTFLENYEEISVKTEHILYDLEFLF